MASGDKRTARVEMAGSMRDIFKKYTRGARKAAWNSMCSQEGQQEMDKLLNNPSRPISRFRTISFKEWLWGSGEDKEEKKPAPEVPGQGKRASRAEIRRRRQDAYIKQNLRKLEKDYKDKNK